MNIHRIKYATLNLSTEIRSFELFFLIPAFKSKMVFEFYLLVKLYIPI